MQLLWGIKWTVTTFDPCLRSPGQTILFDWINLTEELDTFAGFSSLENCWVCLFLPAPVGVGPSLQSAASLERRTGRDGRTAAAENPKHFLAGLIEGTFVIKTGSSRENPKALFSSLASAQSWKKERSRRYQAKHASYRLKSPVTEVKLFPWAPLASQDWAHLGSPNRAAVDHTLSSQIFSAVRVRVALLEWRRAAAQWTAAARPHTVARTVPPLHGDYLWDATVCFRAHLVNVQSVVPG